MTRAMRRGIGLALVAALAACGGRAKERDFKQARERMVNLLANYSVDYPMKDSRVLEAMRKVPRHEFVPPDLLPYAYSDSPLPIGEGQTISQPFIVAYMTQALELKRTDKILEIGTGSGYQAAVLAELANEVYTIEIREGLGKKAMETLKRLGYTQVHVKIGDGYRGWPEAAPFDAIIVTCAPEDVPKPLVEQLKLGGRMVIPVGRELADEAPGAQELVLLRKTEKGMKKTRVMDVRFVPMTGEIQKKPHTGQ